MYALVRFLNSFDAKEYVVHVDNIKDFHPANKDDFIKSKVYVTHWIDEKDPVNTGPYPCQVLLLAGFKEELHEKRGSKRLPRPVINPSDIEIEDEDTDLQLPAADSKQAAKQAYKKSKQCQAASKSAAYDDILKEHASSALHKNKAARVSQTSTKRHAEDEDAVMSRDRKLKRVRVEARERQEPYEDVIKERNELRKIVATMTKKIYCKFSAILEMLQSSAPQPQRVQESPTGAASEWEHERSYDDDREHRECAEKETEHTDPKPMPLATHMGLTPVTENLDNTYREPAAEALPTAADPKAHGPFTDIGDGKYHVKDGLVIGMKQAEKILGHKKASLVVKDMAQAVWGREGLAERTYGGKLAPKDYRNPTSVVRKQLSPQKVALIIDTVRHCGSRTGVSVKETIDNVSTILSQKIQDIRRSKKNKEN